MPMQIMMQAFSDGKTQIVSGLEPHSKLGDLFKKVSEMRNIQVEHLKIVYAGREYRMEDQSTIHKTLGDLGMKDRSMIQVVTRQPGGHHLVKVES